MTTRLKFADFLNRRVHFDGHLKTALISMEIKSLKSAFMYWSPALKRVYNLLPQNLVQNELPRAICKLPKLTL